MKTSKINLCKLFIAAALLSNGFADIGLAVEITLGRQDFDDGTIIAEGASGFNEVSVGEPSPFDRVYGFDFDIPFNVTWIFEYEPIPVTDATLTLGISDIDSLLPGSQINYFTLDSFDITLLLDAQFESYGGAQCEYNIYSIELPASVYPALSDGIASFTLALQGQPGSIGNGAGLDFCTLNLSEAPEPVTIVLLGLGAILLRRK